MNFIDASVFEHFHFFKCSYRSTSRRTWKSMQWTVETMETTLTKLQSRVKGAALSTKGTI